MPNAINLQHGIEKYFLTINLKEIEMKYEQCEKIAKKDLRDFKKSYKEEVLSYKKQMDKAEKIYMKKLTEFIQKNIAYSKDISELVSESTEQIYDCNRWNYDKDMIEEKEILEYIVADRERWIEEEFAECIFNEENKIEAR